MRQETREKNNILSLKPVKRVREVIKLVSKGKVLDIGAGKGRNSFFLARNGFKVTAIDISPENIKFIKKFSKNYKLDIKAKRIDIRKFKSPLKNYSLVIAVSVLDFLRKKEIQEVAEKIKKSLKENGILYLSVFSTKDSFMEKLKRQGFKETEKNTFYLFKANLFRHFFTKKEVRKLFKELEAIYLKEEKFLDKSHEPSHFHNVIEFIGRKTEI